MKVLIYGIIVFMKKSLAKLEKVDLREIWEHEALDFTNWLAQEHNLNALSQEIGVDIRLIKTEASVGRFSVDILAEEEATGTKIIIENQLEDTDHDHLGKIITYASGYDAKIIIWIVKNAREEHQKAVEWLNERTDEETSFFLIKIELWQIEKSNPAPKFEILASPNEWAKTIKASPTEGELSETKLNHLDFWNGFKNFVRENDGEMRLRTPRPQHWYDISIGNSESHITLTVNSKENELGCELYIKSNKDLFHFLKEKIALLENEISAPIEWIDAAKASRIKIAKKVSGVFDQEKAPEYYDWLYRKTVQYQEVFKKYYSEYKQQTNPFKQ
jgi:uncharacterized protein YqgQ